MKLESSGQLCHEMVVIGHSIISENEEDRDSPPDLKTVETAHNKEHNIEMQEVSEEPLQGLLENLSKETESKVFMVRLRRVSTIRKTHDVETAEVDFNN